MTHDRTLIECNTDRLPSLGVVRATVAVKAGVPVEHVGVEVTFGRGVWWWDDREAFRR